MTLSKILLVEDDVDIQKVVRMSLKLRGLKDILVAQDGEECLAVVAGLKGREHKSAGDDLGVVEGRTVSAAIEAADRSLKEAEVGLCGLRVAGG